MDDGEGGEEGGEVGAESRQSGVLEDEVLDAGKRGEEDIGAEQRSDDSRTAVQIQFRQTLHVVKDVVVNGNVMARNEGKNEFTKTDQPLEASTENNDKPLSNI